MNVKEIADLAKIRFTPEELERIEKDMDSVMNLMDYMKDAELPEKDIAEPRIIGLGMLREDIVKPSLTPQELASQSPAGDDIQIPRILE